MASPPVQFEAAPDVPVFLRLVRKGETVDELEANINISKTILELKMSLSKPLQIEVEHLEVWKDSVQLQDNSVLMEYEISADEVLDIIDKTP